MPAQLKPNSFILNKQSHKTKVIEDCFEEKFAF